MIKSSSDYFGIQPSINVGAQNEWKTYENLNSTNYDPKYERNEFFFFLSLFKYFTFLGDFSAFCNIFIFFCLFCGDLILDAIFFYNLILKFYCLFLHFFFQSLRVVWVVRGFINSPIFPIYIFAFLHSIRDFNRGSVC